MSSLSRRRFLQLGAGATAASMLSPSIARAAAIEGNHRHRSIRDVEHIVVLMQENRSFDHYFGTLRGARLRRPAPGHAADRQERVPPAERHRRGTAVPPRHQRCRPGLPPGPGPRLGQRPPRAQPRPLRPVGAEQDGRDDGVPDPRATSRSTTPSPTRSPSATPTTARCSVRPTRTATTCGPGARVARALAAARSSPTTRSATRGRPIPSGSSGPA